MTHVTCRLTAKNRDQLRNPTLGNRVLLLLLPFSSKSRPLGRHQLRPSAAMRAEWRGSLQVPRKAARNEWEWACPVEASAVSLTLIIHRRHTRMTDTDAAEHGCGFLMT